MSKLAGCDLSYGKWVHLWWSMSRCAELGVKSYPRWLQEKQGWLSEDDWAECEKEFFWSVSG